jgi:TPR repeat protein
MDRSKFDIFISYSRLDFDEVNTMISRIKEAIPWINIWFDVTGIESGDEFQDKIVSAIDDSSIVLFALSENSINKSIWTKKEIMYVKNTSKRIIPVLLKGSALKGWFLFEFGTIDCIDIYIDLQWNKLIKNLSEWFPDQNAVNDQQTSNSINISPEEMSYLGKKYYDDKNYTEAAKYYRIVADQGDAESQCNLGNCYYFENDYSEAVKWYRKAAEQGYARAQFNLGNGYYNGKGVAQDYSEAVKWYRKAAEQGHVYAQFNLGNGYYNGKGVAQDYSEAVKWYRKAAEQGDADAQCNLGNGYYNGEGVAQDYSEAVKWYRKAAEQGHVYAQYNLGWCYEKGQGVEQNKAEAVKWYRKAAEQGFELAIKKLKELGEKF